MASTSAFKLIAMYFVVGGFVVCNLLSIQCNSNTEGDALTDVKNNLYDPQNVLASWDPTLVNPCKWFHITCDNNQRVKTVDLGNTRLSGTLSPRIFDLPNLEHLYLYHNALSGSLPPNLGKLRNLIALDLSGNKFSGKIPASIVQLSKLRLLNLSNNRFSGPIPRGKSLSKFGYNSFRENPGLCGGVVHKRC